MYKEFLCLFLQSLFAKVLLTEILFFVFLQLCIALEQVSVVSLSDIFIKNFPFHYCTLVEVDQMTKKSLLQSEANEKNLFIGPTFYGSVV